MNPTPTQNYQMDDADTIDFGQLLDTLYLERKLVLSIALVIALLGIGYALLATPIYEADFAVQIEDSPTSAKGMLGDMAAMFDTKTEASGEIEILKSRMVVGAAVDKLHLFIHAKPRYIPLIGFWVANRTHGLSTPILGGYVYGDEAIDVERFDMPDEMLEAKFKLSYDGHQSFVLTQSKYHIELHGKVGEPIKAHTDLGDIDLLITKLTGEPGATFKLSRSPRLKTIQNLQDELKIEEKGKQSGVIGVKWQSDDADLTVQLLREQATEYIRQNINRKAEEAEKSLIFLNSELPRVKRELSVAESKYNAMRKARGTINLEAEGQGLLTESVTLETNLLQAKQQRDQMLASYTVQHPSVLAMDRQIQILEQAKNQLRDKIKTLPSTEQELLGVQRDVKVNTDLYTSLLDSLQQLNLMKASKIGTARLIDTPLMPDESVKPKRLLISLLAVFLGAFIGIATALIRKAMRSNIDNPKTIEDATGLQVYATVLESAQQEVFAAKIAAKEPGRFILADSHPDDLSIESLRSFRVALQFAMLDARNNRVMITGPSPGIGKSFIATNLAAILAQAGKRVLLIDMDLHKGHINHYFGLPRAGGLSELLAADKTLDEVIHKSVLPHMDLLTVGTRVTNPSALFLTEHLPNLLEQVSKRYDIVLIDAPPALLVSDVSVIGPHVGTTFLVVRDNMSTLAELHATQKRLAQSQVAIKGVLFNGQLRRLSNTYGYGYGYKYSNYKKNTNE